jgi:maleylacetate reductase
MATVVEPTARQCYTRRYAVRTNVRYTNLMRRFRHEQTATRVVFAAGALAGVPAGAAELGASRVLLIAGRSANGPADIVAAGLGECVAGRITTVLPHVPADLAAEAEAAARRVDADLLLTIGGGSATGLAKVLALRLSIPILAVPTTYAGSEVTPIWGMTDAAGKRTGRDVRVQPKVVVYDPELTLGLPADVTAASGMNALAHCVEACYAPDASPITTLVAEEGVRVLTAGLPRCVDRPHDLDARAEVLYGAWLAGWSLGTATMGLHHKLCHVLGGLFDLPHAPTHSAVLPYATAYARGWAGAVLARVAVAMGAPDAASGLWDLAQQLGAPTSLGALGLGVENIGAVIDAVLADPPRNPRPVDRAGLDTLLGAALQGERP